MSMKGEKVLAVGPFIGEFGWELMGFSSIIRFMRTDPTFNGYKIAVFSHAGRYPIYHNFVDLFVPLPSWYTNYGFPQASYGQRDDIVPNITADQSESPSSRITIQFNVSPIIEASSAAVISVSTHQTSIVGAQGVIVSAGATPGQASNI